MPVPMTVLVAWMALVVAGFLALALTDSGSVRESRPGVRALAVALWFAIVVVGWLGLAYLASATTGGLAGLWSWVRAQSAATQAAMWAFLLPWTFAAWVWQTHWATWLRIAAVSLTVIATVGSVFALRAPKTR